jgi:fibronectin type III domain protein
VNAAGSSPLSAASNAVLVVGPPAAPTSVVALRGNTSASLTWTAPTNDGGSPITKFVVQPRQGAANVGTPIDVPVAPGSTTGALTVTGLTNGTAYTFRVSAVNAAGTGPFTASNSVTPATVPGAPVIGLSAAGTPGGAVTATANWSAPASTGGSAITNYRVTALRVNADGSVTAVSNATVGQGARTRVFNPLPPGNYRFEVVAINNVGESPASARSDPPVAAQ